MVWLRGLAVTPRRQKRSTLVAAILVAAIVGPSVFVWQASDDGEAPGSRNTPRSTVSVGGPLQPGEVAPNTPTTEAPPSVLEAAQGRSAAINSTRGETAGLGSSVVQRGLERLAPKALSVEAPESERLESGYPRPKEKPDPAAGNPRDPFRGLAFPVSESITARRAEKCTQPSPLEACPELAEHLSRFQLEERDDAWAMRTETGMMRAISEREMVPLAVRGLECRTSICFVEVVSPTPYGFLGLTDKELTTLRLRRGQDYVATEPSPNVQGPNVVVTIWSYFREN